LINQLFNRRPSSTVRKDCTHGESLSPRTSCRRVSFQSDHPKCICADISRARHDICWNRIHQLPARQGCHDLGSVKWACLGR